MEVLITGSSGLIGTALSKPLTAGGHSQIRLQRQNNDPDSPVWDPENCLAEYFTNSNQKSRVIISASAVGFYGNRGAEIIDEDSKSGNGFLVNVCVQ